MSKKTLTSTPASKARRGKCFALIIPRFEDILHSYYAGEIIRGVSLCASRINADFFVHIVSRDNHKDWLNPLSINRNIVDGIIFADIDNDEAVVEKAIRLGYPVVILNNILNKPVNYLAVDNKSAAEGVVDYLVGHGHRKIATIAGDMSTQAGLWRLEGYREGLMRHDIKAPRSYIAFGDFLRTPARKAAEKLLNLPDRPTAIFAASDVMALEVLDVAKSMKLRVPEDISVIGFDNNPLSTTGSVPLTTVEQPLLEMGRLGAEMLNDILRAKIALPAKKILPTRVIERRSVQSLN